MAYATTNPPRAILEGGIGGSPSIWLYSSADASTDVDGSGYFTNGYDLGMRDGDLIFVYVTSSKLWTTHTVINAATTVIDLSTGSAIGTGTAGVGD